MSLSEEFAPAAGTQVEQTDKITILLDEWRKGNGAAENELFRLVVPHLRRIAQHFMNREARNHTLQATELVNEIYLRMVAAKERDWRNRGHFFSIAARVMRRYLIDYARRQPSPDFVSFGGLENLLPSNDSSLEIALDVDRLLGKLAKVNPEWCNIVELKYFLGLTDHQVAETLGLAFRSAQRGWHDARNWLFEQMHGNEQTNTTAG